MKLALRDNSDLIEVFLQLRKELESYVFRRVRDPHLAEDLVSEMFLRIQTVENYNGDPSDGRRYLFRMAANLIKDHTKLSRRRAEILHEGREHFERSVPSPEREALGRRDLGIVDSALSELPDRAREILFYSRLHGMTHQEIAEKMGISKSTIEKYIIRALAHCRDRLREAETIPEPSARLPVRKR